jgi:DNA polymerase-3 subunit gamma/tau
VAAQSVAAQSVAGPPVAGQSTAGADGDGDGAEQAPSLGELWQRILAGLELPSTRMLLSQQARLVRLDERQAVVQVAGTWMAMVQTRQALVEQAIARTLGSSLQLVLQAGLDTPTPAASGAPPAAAPPAALTAPPAPRATGTATQPHPIAEPQPAAPPSSAPPGAMALDQQARRLAEFFNGEVIDFDGPLDDALPAEGDKQDGPAGTTSRAA